MIFLRRKGVTLVELLTVLAVVSLLALLVLPTVKTLLTDRKSTSSATMVRNFLEAARARAVGRGIPVAVVFERLSSQPADIYPDGLINESDLRVFPPQTKGRLLSATATDPLPSSPPIDMNFLPYNVSIRMSMAEQPLPVTNVSLGVTTPVVARAPATWGSPYVPPPDIQQPTISAAEIDARNYFTINGPVTNPVLTTFFAAGNEVSFNKSTTKHLIVETSIDTTNNVLWFTTISSSGVLSSLEQAIPSNEILANPPITMSSFVIFPKLRPINGPAVQLPKGTCVDLSLSGFSTRGNIAGRDQRTRFSSAWVYTTTAAPNASELRPVYVVFGPDGGLSRVMANAAASNVIVPVETADDFFFHVGKIDQVVVPVFDNTTTQNLTDPSTYIVRLSPKSGAISVAPATQGIPTSASVGALLELTRQGTYGIPLSGQ